MLYNKQTNPPQPVTVCPAPQVVQAGTRVVTRTVHVPGKPDQVVKTETPVVVMQGAPQQPVVTVEAPKPQWLVGVAYPPRSSVQWLDGQLTVGARVADSPLFINATVDRKSVMVGTTVEF